MDTPTVAGLCVLGVALLIVIVVGAVAIWFLLHKLRELYHAVGVLENNALSGVEPMPDVEKGRPKSRHQTKDRTISSDVSLSDVGWDKESNGSGVYEEQIVPVMELKIEKESVNLYGHKPALGQVMMTAQHYYQKQTKEPEVCPIECIHVMDRQQNVKLTRSTVYGRDWIEDTPTSLLVQGSTSRFENVFSHNKGLFVHRNIGAEGGELCVSGVRLKIPAGAVSDVTLITLGITWDEKYIPTLSKKQALLSPVVLCQPSGLTFNVPARLSFPHAADKILENWEPSILKRDGDLSGEGGDWAAVTQADYEERLVTETRIKLALHHFTLYTCVGESKPGQVAVKLMHIVAFAGKLKKSSFFKPRFYCLNSYAEELSDVEKLEAKLDPHSRMTETTDLIVKDNEEDVAVELAKLSDEWKLAGDRHETLSFELIWHSCHPHCSFLLKPKTTSVTDIICLFHSYQTGNENNPAKLKIAEQLSAPNSLLTPNEGDTLDKLTTELAIMLDPTSDITGDWRDLAEKMNCDLARIRWLSTITSSPTKVLLEKWLEDNKSLDGLKQFLLDIERLDAAEEVGQYMASVKHNPRELCEDEHVSQL